MGPSKSEGILPSYLAIAIRVCIEPKDWLDMQACFERVYGELLTDKGPKAAKFWAIENSIWLLSRRIASLAKELLIALIQSLFRF